MFLKNYTSEVPESQTVHRIEQVLIKCGAAGITKEYKNTEGEIGAVSFQIETPAGKVNVRLPVDKDAALDALWTDYVDGELTKPTTDGKDIYCCAYNSRKRKRRSEFRTQAGRTAWKIVQDWVEVQMSMIQLKQAEALQVFLPYAVMPGGDTFYKEFQIAGGNQRLALGPAKS